MAYPRPPRPTGPGSYSDLFKSNMSKSFTHHYQTSQSNPTSTAVNYPPHPAHPANQKFGFFSTPQPQLNPLVPPRFARPTINLNVRKVWKMIPHRDNEPVSCSGIRPICASSCPTAFEGPAQWKRRPDRRPHHHRLRWKHLGTHSRSLFYLFAPLSPGLLKLKS